MDDEGSTRQSKSSLFHNALDVIGGGRFRVSLPSAKTRLTAFTHSFQALCIQLDDDAKRTLPEVAASATWASEGDIIETARQLRDKMEKRHT